MLTVGGRCLVSPTAVPSSNLMSWENGVAARTSSPTLSVNMYVPLKTRAVPLSTDTTLPLPDLGSTLPTPTRTFHSPCSAAWADGLSHNSATAAPNSTLRMLLSMKIPPLESLVTCPPNPATGSGISLRGSRPPQHSSLQPEDYGFPGVAAGAR